MATATILLAAAPSEALAGQPVTLTASVGGVSPTGTVSFEEGGQTLGTSTLSGPGQASLTISALASGAHQVSAHYTGDAGNAPVASAPVTVLITPLPQRAQAKPEIRHTPNSPHPPGHQGGGPRYTFVFGDGSPGATYYCALDKGPFKRCHSPKVYHRLKKGRHVFRLKSVDAAGEASPTEAIRFFAGRKHPGRNETETGTGMDRQPAPSHN